MDPLIPPTLIASAVFLTLFLLVRFFLRRSVPTILGIMRSWWKSQWLFLNLPVNPLTALVTKRVRIEAAAKQCNLEELFSYRRVLRYKEILFWIALALAALVGWTATIDRALLLGIILLGLALSWPELYLARMSVRFGREAEKGLIHIIDLLRLHVSAGLNLEGAVRSAAKITSGVWGSELQRVVYRLDAGFAFDEALQVSVERFQVDDFQRFLSALKQSRQLGASLGSTLGVQSQLLRTRRKHRAEEQARTAAVKIAVPLVTCVFPALLVIYLAPAVLRVATGF